MVLYCGFYPTEDKMEKYIAAVKPKTARSIRAILPKLTRRDNRPVRRQPAERYVVDKGGGEAYLFLALEMIQS
jgi:hypothetical protein